MQEKGYRSHDFAIGALVFPAGRKKGTVPREYFFTPRRVYEQISPEPPLIKIPISLSVDRSISENNHLNLTYQFINDRIFVKPVS